MELPKPNTIFAWFPISTAVCLLTIRCVPSNAEWTPGQKNYRACSVISNKSRASPASRSGASVRNLSVYRALKLPQRTTLLAAQLGYNPLWFRTQVSYCSDTSTTFQGRDAVPTTTGCNMHACEPAQDAPLRQARSVTRTKVGTGSVAGESGCGQWSAQRHRGGDQSGALAFRRETKARKSPRAFRPARTNMHRQNHAAEQNANFSAVCMAKPSWSAGSRSRDTVPGVASRLASFFRLFAIVIPSLTGVTAAVGYGKTPVPGYLSRVACGAGKLCRSNHTTPVPHWFAM